MSFIDDEEEGDEEEGNEDEGDEEEVSDREAEIHMFDTRFLVEEDQSCGLK